jgi:E3 ubiquitin-protein ligase BOI-like protein
LKFANIYLFCLYREIIKSNQHHYQQQQLQQQNQQQMLNSELYNVQMDSAIPLQTTMHESMLPFYQSNVCDPNRADSGLTYNNPLQRKRSRDFSTELVSLPPHQKNRVISSESSPFLDQVLYQFQNQQSDIDRILAQHVSFFILHLINFFYFLILIYFF